MSNIVVSLFDGMRCGYLALDDANIEVGKYIASEVDKFAIKVANANYPNCINVGDVRLVDGYSFDKVDLLLGGSPCQSFSFAGKRNGMSTKSKEEILTLNKYLELKEQNFEFEGQSYLFWEYVRVLKELQVVNPEIEFLLENVVMSKKWEQVITNTLGVAPIKINSLLVTPQSRQRLYWTNIVVGALPQKDVHIKNILEVQPTEGLLSEGRGRWLASERGLGTLKKAYAKVVDPFKDKHANCLTARSDASWNSNYIVDYFSPTSLASYHEKHYNLMVEAGVCVIAERGRRLIPDGSKRDDKHGSVVRGYEYISDSRSNCLSTVQKDNYLYLQGVIRKLTPNECERLQTVPDNYTNHVSNSQRYKMLGNGWTIKVISHILSCSKLL